MPSKRRHSRGGEGGARNNYARSVQDVVIGEPTVVAVDVLLLRDAPS